MGDTASQCGIIEKSQYITSANSTFPTLTDKEIVKEFLDSKDTS